MSVYSSAQFLKIFIYINWTITNYIGLIMLDNMVERILSRSFFLHLIIVADLKFLAQNHLRVWAVEVFWLKVIFSSYTTEIPLPPVKITYGKCKKKHIIDFKNEKDCKWETLFMLILFQLRIIHADTGSQPGTQIHQKEIKLAQTSLVIVAGNPYDSAKYPAKYPVPFFYPVPAFC